MKKLAAAFDGKSAEMMKPADAERISGYKTGGVSPFGQTRKIPAAIEEQALAHDLVYVTMEAHRRDSLPNHQPSLAAVGERPTPIGGLIL